MDMRKLEEGVAPITAKKRIAWLTTIAMDRTDFSFINDIPYIESVLARYDNINTKYKNLMHIYAAMKAYPEVIDPETLKTMTDMIVRIKKERVDSNNVNVKTQKQEDRLDKPLQHYQNVLRRRIEDLFREYDIEVKNGLLTPKTKKSLKPHINQFAKRFQNLMYMAVYLLQEPLRANWATMHFADAAKNINDTDNWLLLSPKKAIIYMRKFKNLKSFGPQEIALNPEMLSYMRTWISTLKLLLGVKPSFVMHYMITPTSVKHVGNEAALAKNLPNIASKLLLKTLTVNDFRHMHEIAIQTSEAYSHTTMADRDLLHSKLLHTQTAAQFYNVHSPT